MYDSNLRQNQFYEVFYDFSYQPCVVCYRCLTSKQELQKVVISRLLLPVAQYFQRVK